MLRTANLEAQLRTDFPIFVYYHEGWLLLFVQGAAAEFHDFAKTLWRGVRAPKEGISMVPWLTRKDADWVGVPGDPGTVGRRPNTYSVYPPKKTSSRQVIGMAIIENYGKARRSNKKLAKSARPWVGWCDVSILKVAPKLHILAPVKQTELLSFRILDVWSRSLETTPCFFLGGDECSL